MLLSEYINSYDIYMKWYKFSAGLKGLQLHLYNFTTSIFISICLDFEWKNKLRVVRIFFDTPTFDRITKDRAAKFVDMLSAIGGTMGLLTGFSIISAVEIVYFAIKIISSFVKKYKINQ